MLAKKQMIYLICAGLTGLLFIMLSFNYQDVKMIHSLDLTFESILYNFLGESWVPVFTAITNLGSGRICIPISIIFMVYFLFTKRYGILPLLLLNVFCVRWMVRFLKSIYERPRPHVEHLVRVSYYSFPSGHSMDSIAFYGFFAFLLHRELKKTERPSKVVWLCAATIIFLIGLSRVYLGAHYPTDVIGGFLAGGCWLFLSLFVYTLIPEKRK